MKVWGAIYSIPKHINENKEELLFSKCWDAVREEQR